MKLADKLSFVIPTSISPQHPDTGMIESAIQSCWRMFGDEIRPTIICDYPSPFFDGGDRERYQAYIDALRKLDLATVVEQTEFSGQVGAVLWYFEEFAPKPVIYYHHDDWMHLQPRKVDVPGLVDVLVSKDSGVEFVKFHKRTIVAVDTPRRVDHIKVPAEGYRVPLIRCSGWGTSPHFASLKHYKERVLPRLSRENADPHGRRGIENMVYEAYRKEQIAKGFMAANKSWGVFIYGKFRDEAYISHLGIERLKRRRKNGKKHNVRGSGFTFSA